MTEVKSTVAEVAFSNALDQLHKLTLDDAKVSPPLQMESPLIRFSTSVQTAPATKKYGALFERESNPMQIPSLTKMPTLSESLKFMSRGELSTRDLVELSISSMQETKELGAVVHIDEAAVRREADLLDIERGRGISRGLLHGIPVTVKDIIDVAGSPTKAGSLAYSGYPAIDAQSVARLRSSGALMLAKVATHEFALGVTTPQCRNPFDPLRIAGGSSGGSAIAVATGVGVASLGTDTRASLRVPSALCGTVGFKPTFGRVPTEGLVPLSWTIDHVGPITRTVRDAAFMLNVLSGIQIIDPNVERGDLSGLVVGVVSCTFEDAEPGIAATVASILPIFEKLGATLLSIDRPSRSDLDLSNTLGLLISRSEAATVHRALGTNLSLCIPEVRDQLSAALTISAPDYLDAQRHRSVLSTRMLGVFQECDVLIMPTVPVSTPLWEDYEKHLLHLSRNAILWSLLGSPAVSMPSGLGLDGMPVGLQLVVAPEQEELLLRVGIMLEEELKNELS